MPSGYVECDSCYRSFVSQRAANQHMDALDHWGPRYECDGCYDEFKSIRAKDQHMRAVGHGRYQHFCDDCDRSFNNANNLKMHLRSKTHLGDAVTCPFCRAGYATASGLSHHLERGSCPNAINLNRQTIHAIIRERDPYGAITMKQIGWRSQDNAEYQVTQDAYHRGSWVCYLCQRNFATSQALNQHINSPAHQQDLYHCPNTNRVCNKEFSTLAALFNHLESESCGYIRFANVQQKVGHVLHGRGMIAF